MEPIATSDLRGILRYIQETLKEPAIAKRVYLSIRDKINNLDQMPESFPLVRDDTLAQRGIRWILAENYLVFFVVDSSMKRVNIIRVLHSRRDWQNLL